MNGSNDLRPNTKHAGCQVANLIRGELRRYEYHSMRRIDEAAIHASRAWFLSRHVRETHADLFGRRQIEAIIAWRHSERAAIGPFKERLIFNGAGETMALLSQPN